MEMEVLHGEVKSKANSDSYHAHDSANESGNSHSMQDDSSTFPAWLLDNGTSAIDPEDRPLVTTFSQLVRWQHRRTHQLFAAGAKQAIQQFDNSVPCSCCRDMCYLTYVMRAGCAEPFCLRCCQLPLEPVAVESVPTAASAAGLPAAPLPILPPPPVILANAPLLSATDLTVFCHTKVAMYHTLGSAYGALTHSQSWQPSKEELLEMGLTDRFELPLLSRVDEDNYTAEDLSCDYDWQFTTARSPNSCKSDRDTLLLDIPQDGQLFDSLIRLLPAPAADRPQPVLSKTGKPLGGKGARTGRKVLAKGPQKVPSPLPAVRVRRPTQSNIPYILDGAETELSGSLNNPSWQHEADVADEAGSLHQSVKNEAKHTVIVRKPGLKILVPARGAPLEKTMSLDATISRATTQVRA